MAGASRQYDIVVFGATGFTGERVLKYACKAFQSHRRLAAAGRDTGKVAAVVARAGTAEVGIVHADVASPASLLAMAQSCMVVLNCVGPYRHYGAPVVEACITAGTDYLDVSGEPYFLERTQLEHHEAARAAGCLVVNAVGFDCIPAEVGAALAVQALQDRGLTPHTVDSYLQLETGPAGAVGNFATYESAVYGFQGARDLQPLRAAAKAKGMNVPASVPGPKPRKPQPCVWKQGLNAWALPFPGADASVVRRTMSVRAAAGQPVAHYLASFTVRSRVSLALFLAVGAVLQALAGRPWGVALLLRYPGLFTAGAFSRRGPTPQQLAQTSFRMVHDGYGLAPGAAAVQPQPAMRVVFEGPEPGYVATPIIMVEAALELLAKRSDIVARLGPGGVFTPGAALLLHGLSYVDRLRQAGFRIELQEPAA